MNICYDQLDRKITMDNRPLKIVSLVPSQTELLYDLGLDEEVIGITKFCIHPKSWFVKKKKIGGTKKVNIEKIKLLNPDLILANKEENTKSDIEALENIAPVWISDIKTILDAYDMIEKIGALVHKIEEAKKLVSEIKAVLTAIAKPENEKIALYVIWREPIMVAARDTFIDSMLRHLGYENAAKNWSRYPVLTAEQISSLEPELIFLSSEPFPFRHKHVQEFRSMFPKSKVLIVDGELFSWYGSRMLRTKSLESLLAFQD